jgi:hypothetical protein
MHVLLIVAAVLVVYIALLVLIVPIIGRFCAFNDRHVA